MSSNPKLSFPEYAALVNYAHAHGPRWKAALRQDWMRARTSGILEHLRGASYFGPRGLAAFKLANRPPAAVRRNPRKPSPGRVAFLRSVQAIKPRTMIVGHAMESAVRLAKAEALLDEAERLDVARFDTEYDDDADVSWMDNEQRRELGRGKVEVLTAYLDIVDSKGYWRRADSLGGITVDKGREGRLYIKDVRRELALEARDALRAAVNRARKGRG